MMTIKSSYYDSIWILYEDNLKKYTNSLLLLIRYQNLVILYNYFSSYKF